MTERNQRSSGRRGEVLRFLRDTRRPADITEIAERLGVHANTVRFHLETLIDNGQVEHVTADRGAPGRPARLYRSAPGMDPMGPRHYRVLAEALIESLADATDPGRRAADAGRSWGRRQALDTTEAAEAPAHSEPSDPVALLMRMLDQLGFAPEQSAGSDQRHFGLRHCPFLELALERPEVVCPLHLGLMQGAMESWDSSVMIDRLDAFVEPDRCSVHLTAAQAS